MDAMDQKKKKKKIIFNGKWHKKSLLIWSLATVLCKNQNIIMAIASKQLFQTPLHQKPATLLYIVIDYSQLKEEKEDVLYLRILF